MRRFPQILASPYLILVLPPLFWAGNAVVARSLVGQMPPMALSFWRWLLALAILAPFGIPRVRAHWPAIRRQWKLLVVLSLVSVTAYNTMLYLALQTSTALNVTLVAAAIPITIMALAWVWLGEKLGLRQALGVLVSLAGVLLVLGKGEPARLLALEFHAGDGWVVAANLSWAIYSVMLRRYPTGLDMITLLSVQMLFGLPFIAPLYAAELLAGETFPLSLPMLGAIAYTAVFASLLAYLFWNKGVSAVGPSIAGQYTYLVPVFTAVLAGLSLGEGVQPYHGVAFVLIVSGITIATRRRA